MGFAEDLAGESEGSKASDIGFNASRNLLLNVDPRQICECLAFKENFLLKGRETMRGRDHSAIEYQLDCISSEYLNDLFQDACVTPSPEPELSLETSRIQTLRNKSNVLETHFSADDTEIADVLSRFQIFPRISNNVNKAFRCRAIRNDRHFPKYTQLIIEPIGSCSPNSDHFRNALGAIRRSPGFSRTFGRVTIRTSRRSVTLPNKKQNKNILVAAISLFFKR